nr:hypothetical protein [Desulfotomaculum copahuensis]
MPGKNQADYRVNQNQEGRVISIEVSCCGDYIGEMRFQDGEQVTCPHCGVCHRLLVEHRHFHLQPVPPVKQNS